VEVRSELKASKPASAITFSSSPQSAANALVTTAATHPVSHSPANVTATSGHVRTSLASSTQNDETLTTPAPAYKFDPALSLGAVASSPTQPPFPAVASEFVKAPSPTEGSAAQEIGKAQEQLVSEPDLSPLPEGWSESFSNEVSLFFRKGM
jgi:hypothetical protein